MIASLYNRTLKIQLQIYTTIQIVLYNIIQYYILATMMPGIDPSQVDSSAQQAAYSSHQPSVSASMLPPSGPFLNLQSGVPNSMPSPAPPSSVAQVPPPASTVTSSMFPISPPTATVTRPVVQTVSSTSPVSS